MQGNKVILRRASQRLALLNITCILSTATVPFAGPPTATNACLDAITYTGNCRHITQDGYAYKPWGLPSWDSYGNGNSYGSITAAGMWSAWCTDVAGNSPADYGPQVTVPQSWFNTIPVDYLVETNPYVAGERPWYFYYFWTFAKAYTMHGLTHAGSPLKEWYHEFVKRIYTIQRADGRWYWIASAEHKNLATAMAVLGLQIRDTVYSGELAIILGSPATIYVTDEQDRVTGIVNGQVITEIPSSTATGVGVEPQEVRIAQPLGRYTITVEGAPGGGYDLAINGYREGIRISRDRTTATIPSSGSKEWGVSVAKMMGPMNVYSTLPLAPPVVEATVRVKPETLKLSSKGDFTVFIQLPENYTVADINLDTVECEGASAVRGNVAKNTLVVKFDRQDLEGVEPGDAVVFTVEGEMYDHTRFTGTDTIRVME